MNWQDRMKDMVETVLNEDIQNTPFGVFHSKVYLLQFDGDYKYILKKEGHTITETETIEHLPSHWQKHGTDLIHLIIQMKIDSYFNLLKAFKNIKVPENY